MPISIVDIDKPEMVNAPVGLNQVILRQVRRFDCRIFPVNFV